MVELEDLFKFNPKRINYRLTKRPDLLPFASLLNGCGATLQSLDLTCMEMGAQLYAVTLDVESNNQPHPLRQLPLGPHTPAFNRFLSPPRPQTHPNLGFRKKHQI